MMVERIFRKPKNVLFAVGEHTTVLQNRIIATALSFFKIPLKKEEIELLDDTALTNLAGDLSKKHYQIPITLFAFDYDTTQKHFQTELSKKSSALAKVTYGYQNEEEIVVRTVFQEVRANFLDKIVQVQFSTVFVKDLLQMLINGYTPIKLEAYLKLSQEYSGKLYFQIISALTFQHKVSIEYDIETLKKMLGVISQEGKYLKESYVRWDVFRDWVILPAIKDINENSDISISYDTRKRGRKIHWITLTIERRDACNSTKSSNSNITMLQEIGINIKIAHEIAQKYPQESFLSFACKRSRQRAETNPAGYLVTSIDDMFELWEMQQAKLEAEQKQKQTEAKLFQEQKIAEELRKQEEARKQDELRRQVEEADRSKKVYASQPLHIRNYVERENRKNLRKGVFIVDYLLYQKLISEGKILGDSIQEKFI